LKKDWRSIAAAIAEKRPSIGALYPRLPLTSAMLAVTLIASLALSVTTGLPSEHQSSWTHAGALLALTLLALCACFVGWILTDIVNRLTVASKLSQRDITWILDRMELRARYTGRPADVRRRRIDRQVRALKRTFTMLRRSAEVSEPVRG
jgi:hypothetical protein